MALSLLLAFLYALGTVVLLPTPQELVLGATAAAPGWAVITVAAIGRAIGAYLLFFFGERLKRWQRIQIWRAQKSRLQVWITRVEKMGKPPGRSSFVLFPAHPRFP